MVKYYCINYFFAYLNITLSFCRAFNSFFCQLASFGVIQLSYRCIISLQLQFLYYKPTRLRISSGNEI